MIEPDDYEQPSEAPDRHPLWAWVLVIGGGLGLILLKVMGV
jgi:hypothetical protein